MIEFVIGNYSVWFGKFFSCCRYKHYSEEMSSSINLLFLKGDEKRKYDQISRIEHCDMRDIYISNSKIIGSIIMKKDVILKCREELMDLLSKCLGFFFSISKFGFGLYFLFHENDKSSISSCITYLYHDELTGVSAREPFHRQLQPDCYCFDWLFSQISNFAKFCDPSRRMWAFRLCL